MTQRNERTSCFLCTGNYYRSRLPKSSSLRCQQDELSCRRCPGDCLERGVNNIGPMAKSAVAATGDAGVQSEDAMMRMPAQETSDDLERATLIVALKHHEHLPLLQERFPAWAERVEFWHVTMHPSVGPDRAGKSWALLPAILEAASATKSPSKVFIPTQPASSEGSCC